MRVSNGEARPTVVTLGRVIIEKDGPGFLYMLPDGVTGWGLRAVVERRIKRWAERRTPADAMAALIVEWPA